MRSTALAAITLLLTVTFAHAWSVPGHLIAAAIAYEELTPDERAAIDTILADHAFSAKWDAAFPEGSFEIPRGLFRCMLASLYPDEIRDYTKPETFANWHFVDYPLRAPDFALEPRPSPTDDVVYGIGQSEQAAINSAPGADRAKMLSFLLHLVGDIHQPMHCETLFNSDFTPPEGDRGGNNAYVRAPAEPELGLRGGKMKLHAVWDELFGTGGNPMRLPSPTVVLAAYHKAHELKGSFLRNSLPELATNTTPEAWSLETRTKAINDAWLKGELKYVLKEERYAPDLPDGYMAHAHEVANRAIVLAGYRLADELRKVAAAANAGR